jgi:8-oxo-dGTP diphosphatase
MPLSRPAGVPFAAHTAQRVEAYCVLQAPGGGVVTVTGVPAADRPAPIGAGPRVPGAVLGHGERPRDAAVRALVEAGVAGELSGDAGELGELGGPDGSGLLLRQVCSRVVPLPGHPGLHILKLVFEADRGVPLPIDQELLHSPLPAPAAQEIPGSAPRVQRPAAYALVIRDGQVLLSRVTGLGVWTLPGGGIDHGEHPDDAVRRETFEETGLRLASAELVDVDSRHFTGRSPDGVRENFHGVRILYRGTITDRGEPSVQEVDGSTDHAAWFGIEELAGVRVADIVRVAFDRVL